MNMWSLSQNKLPRDDRLLNSGIPSSVISILLNRGYYDLDSILDYIQPSLFDLHSPYLFDDMQKIIQRLDNALFYKEKILLYGDYDADGITGTALLYKVLTKFKYDVIVHIPTREEGYGLHQEIIKKAIDNKVNLIITIDCGITAYEEVLVALKNGIDVIITDHHEAPEKLPPAFGILNPKVPDSGYPFKYLAGVGVAFKLVQALFRYFNYPSDEFGSELDYLDIVALGTIADIVPLIGENRILVKYGLKVMENTKNIGINAILEECSLSKKDIKSGQISYIIAPRINAAGRMDTARLALNLLIEEDYEEALIIAKELSKENYKRQLTEKYIIENVESMLSQTPLPEVIVLSSPNWNHGVIGIVASRLVERYKRPVYLISEEGEIGKGSARGILDYHVLEELKKHSFLLDKFGGHKQAAGFTIQIENISKLREGLIKSFNDSGLSFNERYFIDSIVPTEEITVGLQKELDHLSPYGASNPAPILMTRNLSIKKISTIGKEAEHLKIILESGNNQFEALAFRRASEFESIKKLKMIDIIYSLEINNYLGNQKVQAIIKDYQASDVCSYSEVACSNEHDILKSNRLNKTIIINRQKLVELYKRLKNMVNDNNLVDWQPSEENNDMYAIKIFEELGIVSWVSGTNPYLIRVNEINKTDLNLSIRYRILAK